MSYNFNQLRSTQVDKFLEPLTYTIDDIETTVPTFSDVFFLDKVINLSTPIKEVDDTTSQNKYYYMNIRLYKKSSKQNIKIELINDKRELLLDSIIINEGLETDYQCVSLIIAPNDNYSKIRITLSRTMEDYNIINDDGSRGRKINLEVEQLSEIYNIINMLPEARILKQMGIQGPSGMQMCIDGELIRIGQSKIYEINNGISIKFLGFLLTDNSQFFLLDYKY